MSFGDIYDYITAKCPQLAVKNTRLIQEWILAGYDLEKDIKPAVDHCTRYGGMTIQSYAFFHEAIKSNHQKRTDQESKPIELSQAEKDAKRAKLIAWHRDRGIRTTRVGLHDFDWLDQYEKTNGRVEG